MRDAEATPYELTITRFRRRRRGMMYPIMGGTLSGRVPQTVLGTVSPIMADMMSAAGADLRRLTLCYAYKGTLWGR